MGISFQQTPLNCTKCLTMPTNAIGIKQIKNCPLWPPWNQCVFLNTSLFVCKYLEMGIKCHKQSHIDRIYKISNKNWRVILWVIWKNYKESRFQNIVLLLPNLKQTAHTIPGSVNCLRNSGSKTKTTLWKLPKVICQLWIQHSFCRENY